VRDAASLKYSPVLVGRLLFVLVFLISALYMAEELNRGWVPHDEGALGQSAERVLQGELPHRDFDEIYTGGLSYLNATAFRVFGTNLTSLRCVLYLFFLAWVPSVYYAASRFVSSPIASIVTLLAVAWGLPNYAAAMPSWYNLFFATFGVASILRYLETRRERWLFVAGLCGGVSCLFKVSGLFFIAGVLLFFLFPDKSVAGDLPVSRTGRMLYRTLLLLAVLSYNGLLGAFLRKGFSLVSFLYFVVPEMAVAAFLLWREFAGGRNEGQRLRPLSRKLVPFGAGVVIPIMAFLYPFVTQGFVSQLRYRLFVLPAKRFAFASHSQTPRVLIAGLVIDGVIIAAIFMSSSDVRGVIGRRFVFLSVAILLIAVRMSPYVYTRIWTATSTLLPTVVVLGLIVLTAKGRSEDIDDRYPQRVFLLLSVTAACSLIQFPFSGPIYFCYVAPLLLLATTAVLSMVRQVPPSVVAGLAIFFLLYAVLDVTPGFIYKMGNQYAPDVQTASFGLPRAGSLRVNSADAREYKDLATIVLEHARGRYLFCTPDCPEVYFLFGFRNPTHTLFDFFDEPAGRTTTILTALRSHNVNLVVLNQTPAFSGPVPSDLKSAIEKDFPSHAATQRFEVRWQP
jgi:hypothetical protein